MGMLKVHFSCRNDLDEFYNAAAEQLGLHFPEADINYKRRVVYIEHNDIRDVTEFLIGADVLCPDIHDYQVDE